MKNAFNKKNIKNNPSEPITVFHTMTRLNQVFLKKKEEFKT